MRLLPELDDLLASRETPVRLWWRDDDAGQDDPRLERLLDLAARHAAPVALAVVPSWLEPAAAARISGSSMAIVLQHGISHADYAMAGQRKIELGGAAAVPQLAQAAQAGLNDLLDVFAQQFRPVMVPPWNRIAAPVLAALRAVGFAGWSGWRDGPPSELLLARHDTHIDAVDWRRLRRCREPDELWQELAAQLRGKAREPVGLLTHHRVTSADGFRSLDQFLGVVQDHPKLQIESAARLFAEAA